MSWGYTSGNGRTFDYFEKCVMTLILIVILEHLIQNEHFRMWCY